MTNDQLLCHTEHLKTVKADEEIPFWDVANLDVPDWVVQPFQADVFQNGAVIQENLIHLQNDQEALAFPTSYPAEQAFSQVLHMHSKYRNRLNLIASGALRLKLTSISPSVKRLAANHQAQGSH